MVTKDKKWYVLRVIGGQENKVKIYIQNEINKYGLSSYIESVLVPTENIYYMKNGKKLSKEKVSYPGYIILEACLEGEIIHIIKSIPGVVSFLSEKKGGEPLPLRESEVKKMLKHVDDSILTKEDISNVYFEIGEHIRITEGPFNGFDGIIENINMERMKVDVNVKIFGRRTPIELGFDQIEKLI